MGPGTPAMTAPGRGEHHQIQGGNSIVATYEQDQYLADGTFVLTWQLHWVVGWDPARRGPRHDRRPLRSRRRPAGMDRG